MKTLKKISIAFILANLTAVINAQCVEQEKYNVKFSLMENIAKIHISKKDNSEFIFLSLNDPKDYNLYGIHFDNKNILSISDGTLFHPLKNFNGEQWLNIYDEIYRYRDYRQLQDIKPVTKKNLYEISNKLDISFNINEYYENYNLYRRLPYLISKEKIKIYITLIHNKDLDCSFFISDYFEHDFK